MTEEMVHANGVELCMESFGQPDDPPLLLIGNSLLEWDAGLCERLAAGGRRVVRYDLRDTGRSTTVDPAKPAYTLRDLAADAAALLEALGLKRAHVAGRGPGGWIAQLLALDHPERVRSLTLIGTRPTAPGRADADLPDHDAAVMAELFGGPKPDWTDRDQAVDAMARRAELLSGGGDHDEEAARERAGRVFDRVAPASPGVHQANQLGTVFASLKCGPRWRERLGGIEAPTLVVHGETDPFFPLGNGEALAREIPGARLVTLPRTGAVLTPAAWGTCSAAVLDHVGRAH